jgi:hypothetical protein
MIAEYLARLEYYVGTREKAESNRYPREASSLLQRIRTGIG